MGVEDVAAQVSAESAPEPLLSLSAPFPVRIQIWLHAWVMKLVTRFYFAHMVWRNPLPRDQWPTYTKQYKAEVGPEARIFVPRTYKSGDKPLPLLIDVHGGGFMVGHPVMEDRANAQFAHEHGLLVVSIAYRYSPTAQFPTQTYDVAGQIRAVIEDPELPVDKSRVALIGYSAGGNLALSAVQTDKLYRDIRAVVGVYPTTDMAMDTQLKLAARPADPSGMKDVVAPLSRTFYHCYVPAGVNRHDPLLSPMYAPRDKLPKSMYIIGCEYDMLCYEARLFAEKHAAYQKGETKVTADGAGWQKGDIRWELVKGECHGFDQVPGNKEITARRRARARKLCADIAAWLHQDAFA